MKAPSFREPNWPAEEAGWEMALVLQLLITTFWIIKLERQILKIFCTASEDPSLWVVVSRLFCPHFSGAF